MHRRVWLSLPLAVLVAACGGELRGDGVPAAVTRELPAFESVTVSGNFEVTVRIGAGLPSVSLAGDGNLLPQVQTTVLDKTLRIDSLRSYTASKRIRLVVDTPSLAGLQVLGATQVRVEGVNGVEFRLVADGASSVMLAGRVDQLQLRLTGAGEIDALALSAGAVSAEINGAGRVLVDARDTLAVEIKGAGELQYLGAPQVSQTVLGAGRVLHIKPR